MTITSSEPYEVEDGNFDSVAVYDILTSNSRFVRGAIRGETQLTDDGVPVVWDLLLLSADAYMSSHRLGTGRTHGRDPAVCR